MVIFSPLIVESNCLKAMKLINMGKPCLVAESTIVEKITTIFFSILI